MSRFLLAALLAWPLLASPGAEARTADGWRASPPEPIQAPMMDRLAEPVLGESPTQAETGRHLYYLHCMPCHGDRGQGLTDEWRQVWVEDHQNCWARGCHTGKSELASFYIPRAVPPVTGLSHFQTAETLFLFLRETQPPQRAGALSDAEYWALAAFLLSQDGRLPPGARIGPGLAGHAAASRDVLRAALAISLALAAGGRLGKRPCKIAS